MCGDDVIAICMLCVSSLFQKRIAHWYSIVCNFIKHVLFIQLIHNLVIRYIIVGYYCNSNF
jgi:hypothetical protein